MSDIPKEKLPAYLRPTFGGEVITKEEDKEVLQKDLPSYLSPTFHEPSLPPPPTPLEIEEAVCIHQVGRR